MGPLTLAALLWSGTKIEILPAACVSTCVRINVCGQINVYLSDSSHSCRAKPTIPQVLLAASGELRVKYFLPNPTPVASLGNKYPRGSCRRAATEARPPAGSHFSVHPHGGREFGTDGSAAGEEINDNLGVKGGLKGKISLPVTFHFPQRKIELFTPNVIQ